MRCIAHAPSMGDFEIFQKFKYGIVNSNSVMTEYIRKLNVDSSMDDRFLLKEVMQMIVITK
jgi:hypothetical protein